MKLFRFAYSCYALKVQCLLQLAGLRFEVEDVPYGDRSALVELTGGYMHVPVLLDDRGTVHLDSRDISQFVVAQAPQLVPTPLDGPVWAYSDWCDEVLDDPCFKLSAPAIRRSFPRPADRALYALLKERKYGPGSIDGWERASATLLERARAALAPSERTLRSCPFLFGAAPTLADAALFGQLAMLRFAGIPPHILGESLQAWLSRLEAVRPQAV